MGKTDINLASLDKGAVIHEAGSRGQAWRVVSGLVRLDHPGRDDDTRFASLAVAGDVIGAEVMLFDQFSYRATALSPCVLSPWPGLEESRERDSLLGALVRAEKRAGELIALRCGGALERIGRLLRILASNESGDGAVRVYLPDRREMAEMTALRTETVARVISRLRKDHLLTPESTSAGPKPRGYFRMVFREMEG